MKRLLFFFSFLGLQLTGFGQEQITDFKKSVKLPIYPTYIGETGGSVVFTYSGELQGSLNFAFILPEKGVLIKQFSPAGHFQNVFVSNDTLRILSYSAPYTYFYNVEPDTYALKLQSSFKGGIYLRNQKLYYNHNGKYYEYDPAKHTEKEFLDDSYRLFTLSDFKEVVSPEVYSITESEEYHLLKIKNSSDGKLHLYIKDADTLVYWGEISYSNTYFVRTTETKAYVITTASAKVIVEDLETRQQVYATTSPAELYFTATNVFGGQTKIAYLNPVVYGDQLYFMASAGSYNYLYPLLKESLFLYAVNLKYGDTKIISSGVLIPEHGFKGLAAKMIPGEQIYSLNDDLTFNTANYKYQLRGDTLAAIEKATQKTAFENIQTYPLSQGGYLSYTEDSIVFWSEEKEKVNTVKFPEERQEKGGFHGYSKGQEHLWIVNTNDDNHVAISAWDSEELTLLLDSTGIVHSAGDIRILESKNRIDDTSVVLIWSANGLTAYTYDYSDKTLQFLGKTSDTHLYYTEAISFTFHKQNGEVQILAPVNYNAKEGVLEKVSSATPFRQGFWGSQYFFFVDANGYHRMDMSGVKYTIEPFPVSGISPGLLEVSEKYLIAQVNGKVYLTDRQTGQSKPVNLPVESLLGYRYFQRENRIYGISQETYRVYSYDVDTDFFSVVKQFEKSGFRKLEGKETLFYSANGITEIWVVQEAGIVKITEFKTSENYKWPDGVAFLPSEKGVVYWNPYKQQAKELLESLPLADFKWLDSLNGVQLFLYDNELWSFSPENKEFFLLKTSPVSLSVNHKIKTGNVLLLGTPLGILQTTGLPSGTFLAAKADLAYLGTGFLEEWNNSIYFTAFSGKFPQLFRMSKPEIQSIVLSTEVPAIHFSFYPNPTSDFLTLNATVKSSEKYAIRVFSTDGKLQRELQSTLPQNIDFSGLKTGVYLINVTNSKENRTFRVIKN